jgi:hypothetical protein
MLFHAPLKILTRAKRANEQIADCGMMRMWSVDKETLNSVERCGQKS